MKLRLKYLFLVFVIFGFPANSQCICEWEEVQEICKLFKEKAEQYNAKIEWRPVRIVMGYKDVYNRPVTDYAGYASLNGGFINIQIKTYNWQANPTGLLFHELGHYYLTRGHYNGVLGENNTPASIMSSWYHFDFDSLLNEEKEYYYEELFTSFKRDVPDSIMFFRKPANYYKSDRVVVKVRDEEGKWMPLEGSDKKERITQVNNEKWGWSAWVDREKDLKFKILTKYGKIYRIFCLNQSQSFEIDFCIGYSVNPQGEQEIKYSFYDNDYESVPITFIKPNVNKDLSGNYDLEMIIRYPTTEIIIYLQQVDSF